MKNRRRRAESGRAKHQMKGSKKKNEYLNIGDADEHLLCDEFKHVSKVCVCFVRRSCVQKRSQKHKKTDAEINVRE